MNILNAQRELFWKTLSVSKGGLYFQQQTVLVNVLYTKIFLCRLLYQSATERQARKECDSFVTKNFRYMLKMIGVGARYTFNAKMDDMVGVMLLSQASAEMDEDGMM